MCEKITINCNNNFRFLKFIEGEDDELKERADILKDGKYFSDDLKKQGTKKGWVRWDGEEAIYGSKEELKKAREKHKDIPVASKITGIEFDRDDLIKIIEEAEEAEEKERKEEEEKEKKEQEELDKKRKRALEDAKILGKNMIIRKIGGYDGDIANPGEELGWVNIYEVATPQGEIEQEEIPTY